jgi:hypothetical protein
MQRSWAREDWGWQDMTRNLQWGWKREDFEEEVRFMGGRQRKLAERQMRRETTMFGLEGERIDTERKRQEESWDLEDERFDIQRKHYEQSKKLQEEAMEMNRRFYEEQKKMQEEQVKLERAFYVEQQKLQEQAIGTSLYYAQLQHDNAMAMLGLQDLQDTTIANSRILSEKQAAWMADMISTLDSMLIRSRELKRIHEHISGYADDEDMEGGRAGGGQVSANATYLIGERGPELFKPYATGLITPTHQLQNPWDTSIVGSSRSTDKRPVIHLAVNIGDERLGTYILDTVQEALEV